jgi:hypothetical protein
MAMASVGQRLTHSPQAEQENSITFVSASKPVFEISRCFLHASASINSFLRDQLLYK